MSTYDLVIIGSGTAAQAAGSRVRRVGWTVALVDQRDDVCLPNGRL